MTFSSKSGSLRPSNISSSKRSSDMLLTSSQKRMLLTSSQKRTVNNIKDEAYEVGYKQKHIKDIIINGVHVRITRGNDVELTDRQDYRMSHKVRWGNNTRASDPSWGKLKHFLKNNVLFSAAIYGETTYKQNEFMCEDFAAALHNNAESTGIKCAYVGVFGSSKSHSLVLFNTTDKGWVFVDPTAGMVFSKRNFFNQGENYTPDFAMVGESEITRSQLSNAINYYFRRKFRMVEIQW